MKNFTSLFLIMLAVITAQAQSNTNKTNAFYFDLGFDIGIPVQEFKNTNEELGVGGGFGLFFQPSVKIPILIGADFAFMNNGYKMQRETLTADIVAGGTVIETLYFPMRIETSNSINTGHLDLRFLSPTKFFKPYVDAFIGFNNFTTNTSIWDESEEYYLSEEDNPLITRTNQNSDWTYNYGGAFGLLVEVNQNFLINARVAYQFGGEANYYVEDDIEEWEVVFNTVPTSEDDIDEDDIAISAIPKQSTTDMILGTIGVAFRF
jgi:hypothetical protein